MTVRQIAYRLGRSGPWLEVRGKVLEARRGRGRSIDDGRTEMLEAMLRTLADQIQSLHAADAMLPHAGELMKMSGDVRRELFHVVKCPSRRIPLR